MIERLRIKNFENHKDTTLDDFSPGLNLLIGDSDSGKSSVLRALRLVCYNEWTPEALRIGAKYCEIILTTDKGTVKVRRGQNINDWWVTKKGQIETEEPNYTKPGTKVIPEVAEIVGIKTVEMGSYIFRPNIVDQLDGQFFIDQVEGQDISGSIRAQILDEISGLSGIEELIRDVSLDEKRTAKEHGEKEERIKELTEQKHDETELEKEETVLAAVQSCLQSIEKLRTQTENMERIYELYTAKKQQIETLELKVLMLPDVDMILHYVSKAQELEKTYRELDGLTRLYEITCANLSACREALDRIPETQKVYELLSVCEEKYAAYKSMLELSGRHERIISAIDSNRKLLDKIPDVTGIDGLLDNVVSANKSYEAMVELSQRFRKTAKGLSEAQSEYLRLDGLYKEAMKEEQEFLAQFEVCPFCNQPIEENCCDKEIKNESV